MFFRGQKASLCLVIVGLITVHTIGVNHPHHWCLLSAQCVRGLCVLVRNGAVSLLRLILNMECRGILIRYIINVAMTS